MRDNGIRRHQQELAENQQDNKTDNPLPVGDSQPQQKLARVRFCFYTHRTIVLHHLIFSLFFLNDRSKKPAIKFLQPL